MTYAEAVSLKSAIETALLTASTAGAVSVSHGDRSIVYGSPKEARTMIAELNRSIQVYNRKSKNRNPHWTSPIWR